MHPSEFQDSLLILDDCATIRNHKIRAAVEDLQNEMLEIGRHYNASMLITSHLLFNYLHTRRLLNESTATVVFPRSGSGTFNIKRFLQQYCGLSADQIKKFIRQKSRWVAVYRMCPMIILSEHSIYIVEEDEDCY